MDFSDGSIRGRRGTSLKALFKNISSRPLDAFSVRRLIRIGQLATKELSHPRKRSSIAAHHRSNTWSTVGYLNYPGRCGQRTMWLLTVILTPYLATYRKRNCTSEANFISHPNVPANEVVSFKFDLTTDYFWRRPMFVTKFASLHSVPSSVFTAFDSGLSNSHGWNNRMSYNPRLDWQ